LEQLFLTAIEAGKEPADYTWSIFSQQGVQVVKEGKVINDPQGIQEEIHSKSREFQEKKLPIYKRLGIW
jgi:hypothetical protein